eukprot:5869296-Prymnesium_polylepis.2
MQPSCSLGLSLARVPGQTATLRSWVRSWVRSWPAVREHVEQHEVVLAAGEHYPPEAARGVLEEERRVRVVRHFGRHADELLKVVLLAHRQPLLREVPVDEAYEELVDLLPLPQQLLGRRAEAAPLPLRQLLPVLRVA